MINQEWKPGIANFWIRNVRLTKKGNEYIPANTIGDLNVIEVSTDHRVLQANFYPRNYKGFGLVIWPEFSIIGKR